MTEQNLKNNPIKNLLSNIDWFWVTAGTVVGLILIGILVLISYAKFHNPVIPYLITGLAYILTGMILGHYSSGHTIKEAALVGMIIPIVGMILTRLYEVQSQLTELSVFQILLLIVGGILLTQLGGWIGEEMEGFNQPTKFIQWHWIIVASVVGFMLNCFILFFVSLFFYKLIPIALFLALSVIASGIVAGYKSPGNTELECGIAGTVTILFNYLFLKFGLDIEIPVFVLLIALIGGGIFGLFGGWVGEKIQQKEELKQKELES
ncbi:hypothetical protein F9K33_00905 [bacterium]|nr:MAG: hypothetical protein F9K33_00905 [bacterium]